MIVNPVLCSGLSRADALAGLFIPSPAGRARKKDKRQRVVPPAAAGVFLAGFVMIAPVIGMLVLIPSKCA
jgi:hypothetical protein